MRARFSKKEDLVPAVLGLILALAIVYAGLLNSLIAFLVVGAIPGTALSISPYVMMLLFLGLAIYSVIRVSGIKISLTSIKRLRAYVA